MTGPAGSRFPLTSEPGTLEIVEARDDSVVCFALAGEMDLGTAPRLPTYVRDALSSGARNVCIDMAGVSFIDSTGLAALLKCQRSIARSNGRLTVVHNGGEVLRLFELSKIDRALDLHTSRAEALASLASAERDASGG